MTRLQRQIARRLTMAIWSCCLPLAACASSAESNPGAAEGAGPGGSSIGGGPASAGGSASGGGGRGGASAEQDPLDAAQRAEASPKPSSGPGCGFPSPAFCDTFDAPSGQAGRAGDLDPQRWSASRICPLLPTGGGQAMPIGSATIPACRAGAPSHALPDQDTLICDPNASIASNHLLVAVAAQNYGENSYRIRQPFDFAGRTGKIAFDAQGYLVPLLGWVSLEITEDPIGVPSFDVAVNYEGGIIPKNGVELEFDNPCGGGATKVFSLSAIHVFENYADTVMKPPAEKCVAVEQGKLNHFEVQVSEQRIEVSVSASSADGKQFDAPQVLFGADVHLPFSRGYVHISTHNHATLKYSDQHNLDSWISRWDNVGFDGPVIDGWREYDVADSLTVGKNPNVNPNDPGAANLAYIAPDVAKGASTKMHLAGVSLDGVTSAKLAVSSWYLNDGSNAYEKYTLKFRFNGGAWHDRVITAEEVANIRGPKVNGAASGGMLGALGQMIDVPLSDLVAGDNTLEMATANVPQNYPPAVANVSLILETR